MQQVSAAASARAHKRVTWRKPAGRKRPGVLDATSAELVRCLERRQGAAWFRICRQIIVAGYAIDRARDRVRALRRDGAESLLAMSVALLYLADVRTGFLGKPGPAGGRWTRYTLADISQLAFGSQSAADIRRARRALDMMVFLGWAFPTKQVRRHAGADAAGASVFRSEAAVRRLNLARLCGMFGTAWLLGRDRAHADRTKGAGNVSSFAKARAERQERARSPSAPQAPVVPTRSTSPPPRRAGSATELRAIADILKSLAD